MLNTIRKIKIRHRLILIFLVISILPTLIIGLYSYRVYSLSLRQKLIDANLNSLSLISQNISSSLERYQYFMDRLYLQPIVQDSLIHYSSYSEIEKEDFTLEMKQLIENDLTYPLYMQNVMLVSATGDILYESGYDQIETASIQECLSKIDSASPYDCWVNIENTRHNRRIVYGRRVNNMYDTSQHIGYLLLFMHEALFTQKILDTENLSKHLDILFFEPTGEVLASSNDNIERGVSFRQDSLFDLFTINTEPSLDYDQQGNLFNVTYLFNKGINGYVAALMPYSYIESELSAISGRIVFILCITVLVSLLFSLLIYWSISVPIKKAVLACKKIRQGAYSLRIADTGTDELHFLAENIDIMVDQIQLSMKAQEENMERERQMELQMLQYQINPHFLFNTLGTFRWIAMIHKIPSLVDMSTALSEILHSTLMDTQKYISLKDELINVQHYIKIQTVRYAEKFEYFVDATSDSLDSFLPKFILQPLVENCILHGTYDTGKVIKIFILAFVQKGYLHIHIVDTGKGFETSSCKFIEKEGSHHIGVANIKKRLSCVYGSDHHFSLTGKPGFGTECILILPLSPRTEAEEI